VPTSLIEIVAPLVRMFGGSLGGLTGLDLVARHPQQVRTLVVHEPPATELLPEQEVGDKSMVRVGVRSAAAQSRSR
jgi:pimeloyl-ACP methyl ester carboxylesterase